MVVLVVEAPGIVVVSSAAMRPYSQEDKREPPPHFSPALPVQMWSQSASEASLLSPAIVEDPKHSCDHLLSAMSPVVVLQDVLSSAVFEASLKAGSLTIGVGHIGGSAGHKVDQPLPEGSDTSNLVAKASHIFPTHAAGGCRGSR